jgi:hypothetical protein
MTAPFKITTPDPAFNPRRELIVNGYLYVPTLDVPARELAEALQCEPEETLPCLTRPRFWPGFVAGALTVIALIGAINLAGFYYG